MNKRDALCKAAKRLFNQHGYNNVSLRDIAAEADTSLGNLTYFFPKKTDLLTVLVEGDMQTSQSVRATMKRLHKGNVIAELLQTFSEAQRHTEESRYYFRNMVELGEAYPQLAAAQKEYRHSLYEYFKAALETLHEQGCLNESIQREQCVDIAELIVFMVTFWYQSGSPVAGESLAVPERSLYDALIVLLCSQLSEKGYQEYQQLKAARLA